MLAKRKNKGRPSLGPRPFPHMRVEKGWSSRKGLANRVGLAWGRVGMRERLERNFYYNVECNFFPRHGVFLGSCCSGGFALCMRFRWRLWIKRETSRSYFNPSDWTRRLCVLTNRLRKVTLLRSAALLLFYLSSHILHIRLTLHTTVALSVPLLCAESSVVDLTTGYSQ